MTTRKSNPPKKVIAAEFSAPRINASAVARVAQDVDQRRRQRAEFKASTTMPDCSYGNGCNDGAVLAERRLLALAMNYSLSDHRNIALIDVLFPERHREQSQWSEYQRGVVVGFVEEMERWAKAGIAAQG